MRQIYLFAQYTIIYLGAPSADCDEALGAIRGTKLDPRFQKIIESQVLTRPWFTRVWVYQELVLSRIPWVQCGRCRAKWDALHAALFGNEPTGDSKNSEDAYLAIGKIHVVDAASNAAPDDGIGNIIIQAISDMHKARDRKGPPSLMSVLSSRRGSGVTDLRDLIYGHLAVADLPTEDNIPPCPVVDYQQSVIDVFTGAAQYMFELASRIDPSQYVSHTDYRGNKFKVAEGTTYELLSHAETRDASLRLNGLPSWVPDWSLPPSQSQRMIHPSRTRHNIPQGLNEVLPRNWMDLSSPRSPLPNICSIKCFRIGVVEYISKVSIARM
ncbi:hypothetical protein DL98DRAFT_638453 [Cadophora sp. DSE1049]|nr:hypothetical protein DL98DRAFT_638453 [Cadophora sp. DSE1049]